MFGKQIPLFRLFGFDVGIDPTWVMIAVLVTWSLAVGLFPSYYPGLSPLAAWSMGVVGAAGLFASIIFHELSHSLVARRFGLPIGGITLWIFGGVAHMEGEPEAPKVEFWMAIAGPVSSYVLAGGFVLAAWAGDGLAWPVTVTGVFWYLAAINGVLATFNLVPAFPMDGGRVLRAILWARSGNFREATRIASGLGGLFGLGLMAAAAFFLLQGNLVAAVWWFLIGLFVRFAARSSYHQVLVKEALEDRPVSQFLTADPIIVPPDLSLHRMVEDYFYRYYFKAFPVVEGGRAIGIVSLDQVRQVARDQWETTTVGDVLTPVGDDNSVALGTPALAALRQMQRGGLSRLLVVERGRLAGLVCLRDLLGYLTMRLDLEGGDGGTDGAGRRQA